MKKITKFYSSLLLLLFVTLSCQAESVKLYSFGVVPQQSAAQLAKTWIPLLNDISQKTGLKFKFTTAPDIPTFEKRLLAGEYDFAYMNPYHYTVFSQKPGYKALLHAKDKRIKGILVVKKDSSVKTLSDLANKQLAFPSPAAFAASILTRQAFKQRKIAIQPKYVSSHDSVYRAVAKGLSSAGGGVNRTFKAIDPAISSQLRILWSTPGYTPHAIAVHPRVAKEDAELWANSMAAIEANTASGKLLKPLRIKGWVRAEDNQWDDIRMLDIHLLDKLLTQ